MRLYAMSDIHGCIKEFEHAISLIDLSKPDTKLILLGDYIHGGNSVAVIEKVMELQEKYGKERVIALLGNHEEAVIEKRAGITDTDLEPAVIPEEKQKAYIKWMKGLKRFYQTDKMIFCHAGVDEEAEDMWMVGTADYIFTQKYPPTLGHFYMDVIAGHTSVASISKNPDYHRVFYDGKSHYYIDGDTPNTGAIPVLMYDSGDRKYYEITEEGLTEIK